MNRATASGREKEFPNRRFRARNVAAEKHQRWGLSSVSLDDRAERTLSFIFLGLTGLVLAFSFVLSAEARAESTLSKQIVAQEAQVWVSAEAPPASLASLLLVPSARPGTREPTTDEFLAAAVAQGNEPGLERKNPFRKRSIDLFRSEHEVEIWRQEMRVKFRLRPKSKETMSVEVRF